MEQIIYIAQGNEEKDFKKLLEIASEKAKDNIKIKELRKSQYMGDRMVLDNGEVWRVVKGNMSCRGVKWSKCFIDTDIPYERVELDILPNRVYLSQNKEVYF